jgi:hypothetical protein
MKIAVNADAESTVVGVESGRMNFDTSKQAKLFHMLSSSLYSNKPRSILRELASNAHDSHVQAGIAATTPFKIIAPTYENPLLIVKDFGVGLTKEEAYDTILCYLGSTKDNSSDFIGGWGIGSKSPFAYTKSYNVVCVKNGKRVEFACWKDEHGLPTSAVVDERETDEPNGVEMHVPVAAGDVRAFRTTIRSYMQWTNYNVQAEMGGEYALRPLVAEEVVDFDGLPISLFRSEDVGGKIRLVYGGESYDIKDCIDKETDSWHRWEMLLDAMDSNYNIAVVVNTPDSVDFNMNREELEQTPRTVTLINKIVDFLGSEADKRVNVYDSKMKASMGLKTGDEGNRITLASVAANIDKIISEGDSADRVFARAFRIFESTYRFDMEYTENIRTITQYSGVHRNHSLSYTVKPLKDQITVCYGRTYSPSRRDRDNFFYGLRRSPQSKNNILYVRASTEEEAKAVLNATPIIGDFDWTGVHFHHFDIPLPVRQGVAKGGRTSPPRIYDAVEKSYLNFDTSNIYVMRGRGEEIDAEAERMLQIGAMALTPSYKYMPLVFFTPTPDFLKRDHPSNVISMEKAEEAWLAAAGEYLGTWGGLSYKGLRSFRKIEIYTLGEESQIDILSKAFNRAAGRAAGDYERVVRCDDAISEFVAKWKDGGGAVTIQSLANTMKKIRRIRRDVAVATEFIDVKKLIRNRTKPTARKLIATLKIGEWI